MDEEGTHDTTAGMEMILERSARPEETPE
jgi:hypothetical protein